MNKIYFDIETGPLPDTYLDLVMPQFEAPSNYKDEEKIAASIAAQKQKWKERAALSPLTGKILAIGITDKNGFTAIAEETEAETLKRFNALVNASMDTLFIGFNIFAFDIPFLQKRCWTNNIRPPFYQGWHPWRQDRWIDLMETWTMGNREDRASLDAIAKFFGVGAKSGSGADFARLWAEDRPAALKYLENDLNLTRAVAERMGV